MNTTTMLQATPKASGQDLSRIETALVVDDHPIVREALSRVLLEACVGTVAVERTPLEGFRRAREYRPDLAVVDLAFGENRLAGLSFVRRLRRIAPQARILGFSMFPSRHMGPQAIAAGADGYLEKQARPDEILNAVAGLLDRPAGAEQIKVGPADPAHSWMTPRHVRTLTLLASGSNYSQIARELSVSYRTVVDTCNYMKFRLGTSTLQQLVRAAVILLFVG